MSVRYSINPTPAQLVQAADLIDAGEQLAEKLNRKKFQRCCVVVVALDSGENVVGVGAVKERNGKAAEVGYLIVHPSFRRRGIAQELTQRRIAAARGAGLQLLYTNVRRDNIESVGNLQKAGFIFWGDFLSAYQTGRVISWYYFPLKTDVHAADYLEALTSDLKRPS